MGTAEHRLRTAVAARLRALWPGARVLHEVGLDHGQGRADLVVLTAEALHGVELKSPADTLKRLPEQVRLYGETMDRATLVACPKLLPAAQALLPPWWGLWRWNAGALEVVRPGAENPAPSPLTSARLLWREEALAELRELGKGRGLSRVGRYGLYKKLIEALPPPPRLRERIRARLLARENWNPPR